MPRGKTIFYKQGHFWGLAGIWFALAGVGVPLALSGFSYWAAAMLMLSVPFGIACLYIILENFRVPRSLRLVLYVLLVAVTGAVGWKAVLGGIKPTTLEITNLQINTLELQAGQRLRITIYARKQGNGDISNYYLSPNIMAIDFDRLPITDKDDQDADRAARDVMQRFRTQLKPNSSMSLTQRMSIFNTATYPNVSQKQVDGFLTGKTRFYVLSIVGWDAHGHKEIIDSCSWLQPMASLKVGIEPPIWHICR